jgi:D-alanyl-D-alanine carboxypeptidase (penicillin-binding protein 5/6)
MVARARLTVRATGFLATAACTAAVALTLLAPSTLASVTQPAASTAATPASPPPSAAANPVAIATAPGGVGARAAAIENASTGALLWSRGLNTERPMGSITKVMTALVVLRAGDLNRTITIPSSVVGYVREYDASNAGLQPGDTLTARQLLDGLMLPSGCDAAYVLAGAYGAGRTAFVAKMNAVAKQLGMTRTHFANFDGLPWPTEHSTYSTASDLLKLGRAAMKHAVFRSIVAQRTYRIGAGDGHHAYVWRNLDPLLGTYRGATGIKTGYTLAAGHCLLFAATREGHSVIGVTLDSPGSGTTVNGADPARILNWTFALPAADLAT